MLLRNAHFEKCTYFEMHTSRQVLILRSAYSASSPNFQKASSSDDDKPAQNFIMKVFPFYKAFLRKYFVFKLGAVILKEKYSVIH